MQLARDWSKLIAQHPQGFSSQRQAFKALAALVQGDEPRRIRGIGAARGANGGKRARTCPVWRASGPFVTEALRLVSTVDATLCNLVSRGYPLETEADNVHAALARLQTMLEREIVEAEALQAAGEWKFVTEQAPPADSRPLSIDAGSTAALGCGVSPADSGALSIDIESEAGHDD
jgi:hypothetical protein